MEFKQFELIGGALCLDFVNTIHEYGAADPREELDTFADMVAFVKQAAGVPDREAGSLLRQAASNSQEAKRALTKARECRSALYRIFSSIISHKEPSNKDWKVFNNALSSTYQHVAIQKKGPNLFWGWNQDYAGIDRTLWPIVRSAAELLTSDERQLVRECSSETCSWLFLDFSKNRTRRWCDMKTCGNRAKWRRHYNKTKGRHSKVK